MAGLAACVAKPDFAGLVDGPRSATFQERITYAKLDNGLRVALLPDARTNLAGVEVRYEVGGADDPPDAAGLAHYAEHLLFDYVDRDVPMLPRMFEKRLRGYRAIGYARGEAPLGYAEQQELTIEYDEDTADDNDGFP